MYPLLETIRIENGIPLNIEFHNHRCNFVRKNLFNQETKINLENYIQIPIELQNQILKCRVIYTEEIESVSFDIYQIRPIHSLKLVTDNSINYTYKSLDRSCLESLRKRKGDADDILIIKNGFITDTSYANIVFRDNNRWITPQCPLLKGTRRENYLQKGIILEENITSKDIPLFSEARIINAMISIEESPRISINNIY